MGFKTYIKNIKETLDSTFEGMAITLSNFFQRPVTYEYYAYGDPKRMPKLLKEAGYDNYTETLSEGYRGILEVDIDTCTGCSICEKACPIDCIIITKSKNEDKRIVVDRFAIDNTKCMYCGLCSNPCPTDAIQHTKQFEASNYFTENLVYEWAPEGGYVAYNAKKDGERERAELGSLVVEKMLHATTVPAERFPKKVKPPKAEKVKLKAPPVVFGNRKTRKPKEEPVETPKEEPIEEVKPKSTNKVDAEKKVKKEVKKSTDEQKVASGELKHNKNEESTAKHEEKEHKNEAVDQDSNPKE